MPRFATEMRPISAPHPITEFYREEFLKHHRCLQQQRPYYSETAITDAMIWQHPHPPCAATTDHSDVTVTLSIGYQGGTLICVYTGSESGTGPECKKL